MSQSDGVPGSLVGGVGGVGALRALEFCMPFQRSIPYADGAAVSEVHAFGPIVPLVTVALILICSTAGSRSGGGGSRLCGHDPVARRRRHGSDSDRGGTELRAGDDVLAISAPDDRLASLFAAPGDGSPR
jgi:hypothetical protein